MATPTWGSHTASIGTVIAADRANVSDARATVGATIFPGDRLSTGSGGSLQVRTAASRVFLSESSVATVADDDGRTQVMLALGTTVFSTVSQRGLELLFKDARLRPAKDGPTVAQVRVAGAKELLVTTRRGALLFSLDNASEVIPEGSTFRVLLDPTPLEAAAAQGPRGAGTRGSGGPPRKAGRNRFLIVVVAVAATVTAIVIHEALESPHAP